MRVYRKTSVKWTLNGKRVSLKTPQAKRIEFISKRWYGTLRTFDGKRKQVPLCENKDTARTLLERLQLDEDRKRSIGVSRQDVERQRPVSALLDDYETHLRARENTERYITLTKQRINALIEQTKAKTLNDLDAGRIANTLAALRNRKRRPLGIASTNHYTRAIKSFSRWLWIEGKTPNDLLLSLRMLNAKTDKRHVRRALTQTELTRLVDATEKSGKRLRGLRAIDRAMLYLLASYTGLRASELASLTPESFDLDAQTISVQACYSKRRRADTLPLHASLIDRLRTWLDGKTGNVFPGTWAGHDATFTAKMLRSDLERAGIAYRDTQGRVADFHALRHTYITQLARSGIHPSKARELARHSTITLTMDVYSHCETEELRMALDTLPAYP
jgi:integrase